MLILRPSPTPTTSLTRLTPPPPTPTTSHAHVMPPLPIPTTSHTPFTPLSDHSYHMPYSSNAPLAHSYHIPKLVLRPPPSTHTTFHAQRNPLQYFFDMFVPLDLHKMSYMSLKYFCFDFFTLLNSIIHSKKRFKRIYFIIFFN